jgi:hypothetical protein
MSTQNILDKNNLSTNRAIAEYMTAESIEILKKSRFDVGCTNPKYHRLMRTLYRLTCEDWCSIDSDQRDTLREEVILRTIRNITEL